LREGKNACQGNKETPVALVRKATSMESKKPEHRLLHGITATNSWSTVKRFAASVADEMVAAAPEAYVATMSKAKRTGRIFIDYFRNDYTATSIADYAVRARPGAPVALPIDWKELKDLESARQFTMQDVLARLKGMKKVVSAPSRHTIPAG